MFKAIRFSAFFLGTLCLFWLCMWQGLAYSPVEGSENVTQINTNPAAREIKLTLLFTFPGEDDIAQDHGLWDAKYLDVDGIGNYYISDSRYHCVSIYDQQGRYHGRFGRKGNGPGELLNPRQIICLKNFILVNDSGNHRIVFFSYAGEYLKSFPLYKTYYEIEAIEAGKILAVPIFLDPNQALIDVLDFDGKPLYSFGKGKEFKNSMALNSIKIAADDRNVFVAFENLALLQTYTIEGKLISEEELDENSMKEQRRMNIKRDQAGRSAQPGFVTIIRRIRQTAGKLFVLTGFPKIQVTEFKSGKIVNKYWAERESQSFVTDFNVSLSANQEVAKIAVLLVSPENQVRVYLVNTAQNQE